MAKKIIIPDKTKNNYRLTGIACIALNETAFTVGTRNIAGGHLLKIGAYDPVTRKLTIADGDMGKLAPYMPLFLWTCGDDDSTLQELKIVSVDVENRTVTIERDLNIRPDLFDIADQWVGAVANAQRQDAAFASGHLCFAPGEFANASGTLTLASGFGAHAEGVLCQAKGDMSFAVGNMTIASGLHSFASGGFSEASGDNAHASGSGTVAEGLASFTAGEQTQARRAYQNAVGRYNIPDTHGANATAKGRYISIYGNGTPEARANAAALTWDGHLISSALTAPADAALWNSSFVLYVQDGALTGKIKAQDGTISNIAVSGGSPQNPAPIIKNIPIMDGNPALHFALELFSTPDYSGTALESYDTGDDPQGITVNDGSAWIAFPADGIGTPFYGNQLYIIPQSALSNAPYFVRYKFYLKGTLATDEPWNYTIYPANLIGA